MQRQPKPKVAALKVQYQSSVVAWRAGKIPLVLQLQGHTVFFEGIGHHLTLPQPPQLACPSFWQPQHCCHCETKGMAVILPAKWQALVPVWRDETRCATARPQLLFCGVGHRADVKVIQLDLGVELDDVALGDVSVEHPFGMHPLQCLQQGCGALQ